jgi:hypothetical protein
VLRGVIAETAALRERLRDALPVTVKRPSRPAVRPVVPVVVPRVQDEPEKERPSSSPAPRAARSRRPAPSRPPAGGHPRLGARRRTGAAAVGRRTVRCGRRGNLPGSCPCTRRRGAPRAVDCRPPRARPARARPAAVALAARPHRRLLELTTRHAAALDHDGCEALPHPRRQHHRLGGVDDGPFESVGPRVAPAMTSTRPGQRGARPLRDGGAGAGCQADLADVPVGEPAQRRGAVGVGGGDGGVQRLLGASPRRRRCSRRRAAAGWPASAARRARAQPGRARR